MHFEIIIEIIFNFLQKELKKKNARLIYNESIYSKLLKNHTFWYFDKELFHLHQHYQYYYYYGDYYAKYSC